MKIVEPYDQKKELTRRVEQAQSGISAAARVVSEMLCERTSSDCREWAKSDFTAGGLLDAIERLSDFSREDLEELSGLLEKAAKKAA